MGVWRETKYFFRKIKRIKKLEHSFVNLPTTVSSSEKIHFPKFDNPLVSIIIPYYNLKNYTLDCLHSIYLHLPEVSFEIVLVNDQSTEDIDFSGIENVRIINNAVNLGFLKSVNNAIKTCKTPYIYLLNNDTIVRKGFLDELIYVFDNFKEVGAVGSMILNEDGSLQEAGSVFLKDCRITQIVGSKKAYFPEHNYIYEVDYCSGCSLLFKKELENGELNLFDEQFAPAYFEETDMCFRLRHRFGKKIYYTPFSKIVHFNGVSYKENEKFNENKQTLFDKNLKLFKCKWMRELSSIQAEKQQARISELTGNKNIVFYNGVVPEFDKNSGELRLTEIIKAFKAENYAVAIVAHKNKIDNPYNMYFQKMGICVYYEHQPFADKIPFLKRLKYKNTISWFYAVGVFMKEYRNTLKSYQNSYLVYDMVDIHHLRIKGALQLEPKRFSLKKQYYTYLSQEKKAARTADLTVAISDREKKYMERFVSEDKLIYLSNIHYVKKQAEEVPGFDERKGLLFVGSVHPPNIDAVHFLISEIMPVIWRENPEITLNIVGNVAEKLCIPPHDKIVLHGYVQDMEQQLLTNRIMIAPLRFGAGVKGKIGQAFEYSLPVVTTEIGAEGMSLKNCENSLIANEGNEFADCVLKLYNDKNLWLKLQSNSEDSLRPFSRENLHTQIKAIEKRIENN